MKVVFIPINSPYLFQETYINAELTELMAKAKTRIKLDFDVVKNCNSLLWQIMS